MKPNDWTLVILALASLFASGCATVERPQPQPVAAGFDREHPEHPVFTGLVTLAGGSYSHDTSGSNLEGDTSAGFFRLRVEGNSAKGFGGGLAIESMASDDDLFVDEGFTPTEATVGDLFPYFLYRVSGGERFRMPMRVGPYFHVLKLEDKTSSDEIEWFTIGLRSAVEPEFVLAKTSSFEFSLCSEVSLSFGGTNVEVKTSLFDQDYDSSAAMFGFEFGPRFRFSAFCFGVSYIYRGTSIDDSDPENGIFVRGIDNSFNGIAFTMGARF